MSHLKTRLLPLLATSMLAAAACADGVAPHVAESSALTHSPVAPLLVPPSVSAGPDRRVVWPTHPHLDGAVARAPRSDSASLPCALWTLVSGPGSVTFRPDFASATTAFLSRPGVYVLRLTGGSGAESASDEMIVIAERSPSNQPPIVEATDDQVVPEGTAGRLAGVVWDDGLPASPGAVTATWSQRAGPAAAHIDDAHSLTTQVWLDAPGSYEFSLTVTDGALSASDEVVFTRDDARLVGAGQFEPVLGSVTLSM